MCNVFFLKKNHKHFLHILFSKATTAEKKHSHLFSLFFVNSYLLKKYNTLFLYLCMVKGMLFGISWPAAFYKGFRLDSPHQ